MHRKVHLIGCLYTFPLAQKVIVLVLENAWRAGKVIQHVGRVKVHQTAGAVHGQELVIGVLVKAITVDLDERIHLRHVGHHRCDGYGQVGRGLCEAASHGLVLHLIGVEGWSDGHMAVVHIR